ncbi:MAG TPA: autotransporter-associated beta strand repeat-containing protein [Tepidisphaeraceae bacterium]|jgi:autotransporter-associated beta strand protein|nr:autotransporter-associated beta strand repeat-containing protein [Tepidisphaeraceae bacterium]
MTKSRASKKSLAALSAAIAFSPAAALAVATTYTDALFDWAGNDAGNTYIDISNVVVTNDATNLYMQINLNPGTTADPNIAGSSPNPTDITQDNQSYGLYEIGLETVPGAGSTTVANPYGEPIGISTGMNYWIGSWTNQTIGPPDIGDNQVYSYSGGAWNLIAGNGTSPYVTTTTALTPTSITLGIPLASLGLSVGNTFNFDAWTTFGSSEGGAYDALDSGAAATSAAGNTPWNGTPYDSATATGSTYSTTTYTVTIPTFTWDDATAAAGYADGTTWDVSNNYNWNDGIYADQYTDGSNVIFNDNNNNNYAVTLNTAVNPNSVTVNNSAGNYTISGTGGIAGSGSLTKSGSDSLILSTVNTYSGGTTVTAGTLVAAVNGALPDGSLSITGGGVQLAAGTGATTLTSLSISGGGTLDIGNNHVIISDPGGSVDSTIRAYLSAGYNNGNWNGTSATAGTIITSAATGTKYGIGYADGADGGISGITSGQLEVKYTLYGDANLDGSVNSIDFGDMAANFGKSGKVWDQGDFNYDGTVNSIDFGLLAGNFGKSVGGNADVSSADWAALDAFAAANGLMADVPEPATTGLVVVGLFGVLARRRRAIS